MTAGSGGAVDSRCQRIAALLQAGRLLDAELACRELLSQRPADPIALNLFGIALRQQEKLDESETAFRRAVDASGGNPEFRTNLAQLLRARGQLDAALLEFRQAVDAAPGFRTAHLGLARTALAAGRPEEAAREARALVTANARDPEAWSTLGSASYAAGDLESAATELRQAVTLAPAYDVARENLAIVLGTLHRAEEALAEVAECARRGRQGPALELARARALVQLDQYEEADSVLVRLVAALPDDLEAQFLLAQLRHIRGDQDFASALRQAAERPDAPPATRAKYADVLRNAGHLAEAEKALRRLIDSLGPQPRLLSSLATVLQEMGRFRDAVPVLQAAQAAGPQDAAVAETLVVNLIACEDAAAARPIVERFRQLAPLDQRWITYRTDIARQLGESLYADWCDVESLVRVYELEPPPGYRTIGEFHKALRPVLESRHRQSMHPLDQSLRGGTQTSRSLLQDPDPLIRQFLAQLAAPIADYQAAMGRDAAHPLSSRNVGEARLQGCWSVRLRGGGFHVNHIHPEGWISSAYYVSVPAEVADENTKDGWLKFGEPRYPTPGAGPRRFVQPRPGRLVLFPSYLWHGTNPIHGDEPRLTIAFDCVPRVT